MKRQTGVLIWWVICVTTIPSLAQSYSETALLFSRTIPGGSARILGMSGTQISLGGDYSSAQSNPAGLGMYNRSEFTITPGFTFDATNSNYLNNTSSSTSSNLSLPGISIVFNSLGKNSAKGFLSGSFALTYSRTNDFNSSIEYEGVNPDNSIIDYYLETAWGGSPSQFTSQGALFNTPTELAYNTYLIGDSTIIDPNANNTAYFTDVLGIPYQHETIETNGSQSQWNMSYGANIGDRIFFGFGLGIASVRYKGSKIYREEFQGEPLFNSTLTETLEINGTGINGTFGLIGRPVNKVQIGLSVTTPISYNLSDTYEASMESQWDNFQYDLNTILNNEQSSTNPLFADYKLKTPWKFSTGASFFFNKNGFISFDVENVNYGNTKYVDLDGAENQNTQINELFKSVVNVRMGGEYRYNALRFRGGYSFLPDPYSTEQNNTSRKIQSGSLGFGYRVKSYYVDFAIVHSWGSNSYRPYVVNSLTSPLMVYDRKTTSILFTVGFPF